MDDFDTIPVDYQPDFGDAPVAKAGQQIAPQNVLGEQRAAQQGVTSALTSATGIPDAMKALRGEMTPDEAQMFALGALPGLIPGARAEEGAANMALRVYHGSPETALSVLKTAPPLRQFDNATSQLGVWFAPSEEAAKRYAGQSGRVYATDLNLNRPYEMPWAEFKAFQSPHIDAEGNTLPGEQWAQRAEDLKGEASARRDELAKAGYDGVVVRNSRGEPIEISSFNDVPVGIRAYHGSPYDFDKFDLSKIGTGEGAQAYGHGLYFSQEPEVARAYRRQLGNPDVILDSQNIGPVNKLEIPPMAVGHVGSGVSTPGVRGSANNQALAAAANLTPLQRDAIAFGGSSESLDEAIANLRAQAAMDWRGKSAQKLWNDRADALEELRGRVEYKPGGKMYEVNINADPEHFLDWDKPLSEQSPKVQEALAKFGMTKDETPQSFHGEQLYRQVGDQKEDATQALRDAGVAGIKYLDQGSRAGARPMTSYMIREGDSGFNVVSPEPDGSLKLHGSAPTREQAEQLAYKLRNPPQTSNYVVFDSNLINIIKKYGLAGLVAGNAAHFSTTPVDHDPFEDKGMAWGGAVSNKITKIEAKYRGGVANRRCALCDMFRKPSTCTAVKGQISPWAVCKLFERKK